MNLFLHLGKEVRQAGKMLETQYGVHDFTNLGNISRVAALPDVTVSILCNWINQ